MSASRPIMKEVTDDFVSCFGDPANRSGGFWACVKAGILPEGVDYNDPRVVRILSSEIGKDEIVK